MVTISLLVFVNKFKYLKLLTDDTPRTTTNEDQLQSFTWQNQDTPYPLPQEKKDTDTIYHKS